MRVVSRARALGVAAEAQEVAGGAAPQAPRPDREPADKMAQRKLQAAAATRRRHAEAAGRGTGRREGAARQQKATAEAGTAAGRGGGGDPEEFF